MKNDKKFILLVTGLITVIVLFFIFIKSNETDQIKKKDVKPKQLTKKEVQEPIRSIQEQKVQKKEDKYFKTALEKDEVSYIYQKSLKYFKDSNQKEEIAEWVAKGGVFDSSPEYGESLAYTLEKINLDPYQAYHDLSNMIKNISPSDSFIRTQIINLVNQLSIDRESKITFFGNEASRKVILDNEGRFTPHSLNISISLAFLVHLDASQEEISKIYTNSINSNANSNARLNILKRFRAYFPRMYF